MVKEEPKKLAKDLEDVKLVEGDPTKVTKVEEGLNPPLKDKIVEKSSILSGLPTSSW